MARALSDVSNPVLERLLSPRSIAVAGGQAAATVIENCRRLDFSGAIYAIHPSREQLASVPCVRTLADVPAAPDACFLGVSPVQSIHYVEALRAAGAGGAVCYASGFSESGTQGERLEAQLVSSAGNMPFMGPNCHGFINFLDGVALWPDHFGGVRVSQGPALLMQSGNMGINVTFQQRALAPAYVIAMGNNAKLGVHDYVHALLDDARVTAIGLHLESIDDVPALSRAALRAIRQRVPLVALKSGSSTLGADLALSHTRALARPDALVTHLFERLGIARCYTLPEFVETLKFLSTGGPLVPELSTVSTASSAFDWSRPPARIVSMSCSGGEASHVADLAGDRNVMFPTLSETTASAVSDVLGPRVRISNPLDYHTYAWGDEAILTRAFTALFADRFDCALLILDYPPEGFDVSAWQAAELALRAAAAATGTRVVVVASLPENMPCEARERLRACGVAPMQGMAECLEAIVHARAIGQVYSGSEEFELPTLQARSNGPATVLSEHASKQALSEFGFACPPSYVGDARDIATRSDDLIARWGFPLVLKASGAAFAHKTEHDAVRLNISSRSQFIEHVHELSVLSGELLVEPMITDVVAELLVGVRYEPGFGMVLTLGAGGIGVEWLEDSCELLLPISRTHVEHALQSLKIAKVLNGYRGQPAADVEAALDAIEVICHYALAHQDELIELDVNPLVVRARHRGDNRPGAIAVDVLLSRLTNIVPAHSSANSSANSSASSPADPSTDPTDSDT